MTENRQQYRRKCQLIVAGEGGEGLDLSALRITFRVKKEDAETPNKASVRVHNLTVDTARKIRDEFTRIMLQAGYDSNYGVIFDGNITQLTFGKQGTDTYIDIEAGDGDDAYNFAIVRQTLAAGSTPQQQIDACFAPMEAKGVKKGYIGGELGKQKLPRGKVMYGNAREYLRRNAATTNTSWSVQDGKLTFIPAGGLLPSQAVVLNSNTGLIGSPEQDIDGLRCTCLLNPLLQIGGKVKIDEKTEGWTQLLNGNGVYRLLTVEHSGDTWGNEWQSAMTCLDVNETAPEGKQVKP